MRRGCWHKHTMSKEAGGFGRFSMSTSPCFSEKYWHQSLPITVLSSFPESACGLRYCLECDPVTSSPTQQFTKHVICYTWVFCWWAERRSGFLIPVFCKMNNIFNSFPFCWKACQEKCAFYCSLSVVDPPGRSAFYTKISQCNISFWLFCWREETSKEHPDATGKLMWRGDVSSLRLRE